MLASDFAVSIEEHGSLITRIVQAAHQEAVRRYSGCSLLNGDQVRFPGPTARSRVPAGKNEYISEEALSKSYKIGDVPYFEVMKLGSIKSWNLTEEQARIRLDLRRITF